MVVRMVQFVRLWRKLGWSMRNLDRAITAFRPDRNHVDITDEFLIQLSHVQRLHHELNMPVIRLFAWWAEIDRGLYIDHGVPGQPRAATLYDQLFRNKAVINPPDPAFTEDPSDLGGKLTDGYDLRLMSWGDGSGVPTSGNNLVIVGIDNDGLLHIRIFDAGGNRVTDTDETKLPDDKSRGDLGPEAATPGLVAPARADRCRESPGYHRGDINRRSNPRRTMERPSRRPWGSARSISRSYSIDTNVIPLVIDQADPEPNPAKKRRIPDDTLNLGNLSRLFRHASLARALGLPVRDYLTGRFELIDTNPFASTTETLLFVEKVGKVRASGFSLEELDYLLRHRVTPASSVAPDEQTIAMVLDEIRGGLQTIAERTPSAADPTDPGRPDHRPERDTDPPETALLRLGDRAGRAGRGHIQWCRDLCDPTGRGHIAEGPAQRHGHVRGRPGDATGRIRLSCPTEGRRHLRREEGS